MEEGAILYCTMQSAAHGSTDIYELATRNPPFRLFDPPSLPLVFPPCTSAVAIDLQTHIKLTYALELSRWPAAECGMYLCTVISRGKCEIIVGGRGRTTWCINEEERGVSRCGIHANAARSLEHYQ